jgi:hypothetical protein
MPYSSPSRIRLDESIDLNADGAKVTVPLKDVLRIAFDQGGQGTLTMKNGEAGKIAFIDVSRLYGRLRSGEIVFHEIPEGAGLKLKTIDLPR